MKNKEIFLKLIGLLKAQMDETKEDFIEYFKDKTIPLEDRWEVFAESSNKEVFNNLENRCWNSKVLDKIGLEWYDDFGIERYTTGEFVDIIEIVKRNYKNKLTHELVDELKEEMLQSGYSGFVFDW